jgi:hypothetical protein
MSFRAAILVSVAACGGGQSAPSPASARVSIAATAEGKPGEDAVVAQVNGRPVWGSCVAHQGGGKAGLDQCVDFELLAQAAEARGAKDDPEVARALSTALVNRLVETKYEDRYAKPADFGPIIERVVDQNARQMHRPETRDSEYIRVVVDPKAPDLATKDAAAHAIAQKLAEELRGEHGLLVASMQPYADEIRAAATAAGLTVELAAAGTHPRGGLVPTYGDALWAIGAVGDTTPDAIRTQWGWDVILLTNDDPPRDSTREELAAEVFPDLRRSYFEVWEKQVERALGVQIQYFPENDKQLDALPVLGVEQ